MVWLLCRLTPIHGDLVMGVTTPKHDVLPGNGLMGYQRALKLPETEWSGASKRADPMWVSTRMVAADDGTKHIAYYDVDAQALKYALGKPNGMTHDWTTVTVDAEGDAGRWPSITIDAMGRPSVAYRVGNLDGESQVRFRQASSPSPTMPAEWGDALILHRVMINRCKPV